MKLRLTNDVIERRRNSNDVSYDHILIPVGTILEVEEIREPNVEERVAGMFAEHFKPKEKSNCVACGGSGSIQGECPDYKGGGVHCLVYHTKPCPNCLSKKEAGIES